MNKNFLTITALIGVIALVALSLFVRPNHPLIPQVTVSKFDYLSKHGNSSCSAGFVDSISRMNDTMRMEGSCCSPMVEAKYNEQVEGLKKYKDILEIPPDPYDIPISQVKQMLGWQKTIQLTTNEQAIYDRAMQTSLEHGPCCCHCWHWLAYEGLAKQLIRKYTYTPKEVATVWDLSDGCGGDDHHDT